MRLISRFFILTILAFGFLVPSAVAAPKTTDIAFGGQVLFRQGTNTNDPTRCGAIVFVSWPHVLGTRSVIVRSTVPDEESGKYVRSVRFTPPFDDRFSLVRTFRSPEKRHWVALDWRTKKASFGQKADCSKETDIATRIKKLKPEVIVRLAMSPEAKIRRFVQTKATVSKNKILVARVACPKNTYCTIARKQFARILFGDRVYWGKLEGQRTAKNGKVVNITLTVPKHVLRMQGAEPLKVYAPMTVRSASVSKAQTRQRSAIFTIIR